MSIEIGSMGVSYNAGYYQNSASSKVGEFYSNVSSAAELVDGSTEGDFLGITMIPEEVNGVTYGMRANYATDSTEKDPIVQITSNYGGRSVTYKVHINEVDPRNASQLEMFALCSYADDKGLSNQGTFGSFQQLKVYGMNAEHNEYCNSLSGHNTFLNEKFDWTGIVSRMMDDYLGAGLFDQYQSGTHLMAMFEQFSKGQAMSDSSDVDVSREANVTKTDYLQIIREKIDEIVTKIQNGDTEPTYQIGSQSFTEKEWDTLLEQFDTIQEALKKLTKEAQEQQIKAEESKAIVEETTIANKQDVEMLTMDSVRCTYPKDDGEIIYIIAYDENGIRCKHSSNIGEEGYLWEISFSGEEEYRRVCDLMEKFPTDGNLRFASHENFWEDFLDNKIDEADFLDFFSTTNHGIPDYTYTAQGSMYIDKEKAKYAKYMNPHGGRMYSAEEMMAMQDEMISKATNRLLAEQ